MPRPRKTKHMRGRWAGYPLARERDLDRMDGPKGALEREADRILREAEEQKRRRR